MQGIYDKLFKRLLHIRINGQITNKTANHVYTALVKAKRYDIEAVLVSINSAGGSLTQSKNIIDSIKVFSIKKASPVYCFAQDACLNSANLILTSGTKCYANRMTLIGDLGYVWQSFGLQTFAEKNKIKQEFFAVGQNKVKFNPFEELKDDSVKWMKNYLYTKQHDLKVGIVRSRAERFKELKLNKEDIEKNLLDKGIVQPINAEKYGMIDGLINMDDFIKERYDSIKVLQPFNQRNFKGLRLESDILNII